MIETTLKANQVNVGFHPQGYRIDKTAEPKYRYTKWDITGSGWSCPVAVSFSSLPTKGWIAVDKFDWEKITQQNEIDLI